MTVKEDIEARIKEAQAREDTGDFGARIMKFGLISAMERMDKDILDSEVSMVAIDSLSRQS